MSKVQISLDGGITWQDAPESVQIKYENLLDPLETSDSMLIVNATHEGLIMDVWSDLGGDSGLASVGTSSETAQEIVDRLVCEEEEYLE